jgi:hypothetical protein
MNWNDFGTEKFRKCIEYQEFVLETNNQAMSGLLSYPRQLGKIGRWAVKISALKFQVRHIRETKCCSRHCSSMFESSSLEVPNHVTCHLAHPTSPLAFQDLGQLQRQDSVLADIIAQLQRGDKVENYSLSKGTLYCFSSKGRSQKIVVPAAAIPTVFAFFHDSMLGGLLGVLKTINDTCSHFIWKGMDKDIRSGVRACPHHVGTETHMVIVSDKYRRK